MKRIDINRGRIIASLPNMVHLVNICDTPEYKRDESGIEAVRDMMSRDLLSEHLNPSMNRLMTLLADLAHQLQT